MDWQTTVNNLSEAAAYLYENNEMTNVLFVVGQNKEVCFYFIFYKVILLGNFRALPHFVYALAAF